MSQAISKSELATRLIQDRGINRSETSADYAHQGSVKSRAIFRRRAEKLDEIRELGNKNLHGWELPL